MLLQQNWTPYGHHACNTCCVPYRLMATAPVQATQQATATRSNQPGARTGSPALAMAPWMSSMPPLPSGQSACLSLWDSLPFDWSVCPLVCLSMHLPVHLPVYLSLHLSVSLCPSVPACSHPAICLSIARKSVNTQTTISDKHIAPPVIPTRQAHQVPL